LFNLKPGGALWSKDSVQATGLRTNTKEDARDGKAAKADKRTEDRPLTALLCVKDA